MENLKNQLPTLDAGGSSSGGSEKIEKQPGKKLEVKSMENDVEKILDAIFDEKVLGEKIQECLRKNRGGSTKKTIARLVMESLGQFKYEFNGAFCSQMEEKDIKTSDKAELEELIRATIANEGTEININLDFNGGEDSTTYKLDEEEQKNIKVAFKGMASLTEKKSEAVDDVAKEAEKVYKEKTGDSSKKTEVQKKKESLGNSLERCKELIDRTKAERIRKRELGVRVSIIKEGYISEKGLSKKEKEELEKYRIVVNEEIENSGKHKKAEKAKEPEKKEGHEKWSQELLSASEKIQTVPQDVFETSFRSIVKGEKDYGQGFVLRKKLRFIAGLLGNGNLSVEDLESAEKLVKVAKQINDNYTDFNYMAVGNVVYKMDKSAVYESESEKSEKKSAGEQKLGHLTAENIKEAIENRKHIIVKMLRSSGEIEDGWEILGMDSGLEKVTLWKKDGKDSSKGLRKAVSISDLQKWNTPGWRPGSVEVEKPKEKVIEKPQEKTPEELYADIKRESRELFTVDKFQGFHDAYMGIAKENRIKKDEALPIVRKKVEENLKIILRLEHKKGGKELENIVKYVMDNIE